MRSARRSRVLLRATRPAELARFFAPDGRHYPLVHALVAADCHAEARREDRQLPAHVARDRATALLADEHALLSASPGAEAFLLVEWDAEKARIIGKVSFAPRAALGSVAPTLLTGRHALRPGEDPIDRVYGELDATLPELFLLDLVLAPDRRGDGTRLGATLQRAALRSLAASGTRIVRGTTEFQPGRTHPALTTDATNGAEVLFGKELDGWVAGTRVRTYALVLRPA